MLRDVALRYLIFAAHKAVANGVNHDIF